MTTETPTGTGNAAFEVPTTKILAIGRVTSKGSGDQRKDIMPHEVRETVRLHLHGHIDQWFTQTEAPGVVFILNMVDPAAAHTLLRGLPLGLAGMMEFELIPLGPLKPLNLLL